MKVLIDTCIWSEALRRQNKPSKKTQQTTAELNELIKESRAQLTGITLQELLSGIKDELQFCRLKKHMSSFPLAAFTRDDYTTAAKFYNICRNKGISGSHIDYLICAYANQNNCKIFTTDKDFIHYAKYLPIKLHSPR